MSNDVLEPSLLIEHDDLQWMENRLGVSLSESKHTNSFETRNEADLLNIKESSCIEFAKCFEQLYRICILPEFIPKGNPADPVKVAEFVQLSREICSQMLPQEAALKLLPKVILTKRDIFIRHLKRVPIIVRRNYEKLIGKKLIDN